MKMTSFLIFILFACNGYSQSSNSCYVTNSEYLFDSLAVNEALSSAAQKTFNKMFGNVENPRWHVTDEGSTVKFKRYDISYHVFYNKRGKWKATIQYLPLNMVPRWLTRRVKSDFRNFTVFFAQHVKTPVGNTYMIKIEKGYEWKYIRISPELTEVLGEYVRN